MLSESRVTWATYVPILAFLGLSVLNLDPMYATDRQTSDVREHHRLMPPGRGHNNKSDFYSAVVIYDTEALITEDFAQITKFRCVVYIVSWRRLNSIKPSRSDS